MSADNINKNNATKNTAQQTIGDQYYVPILSPSPLPDCPVFSFAPAL